MHYCSLIGSTVTASVRRPKGGGAGLAPSKSAAGPGFISREEKASLFHVVYL